MRWVVKEESVHVCVWTNRQMGLPLSLSSRHPGRGLQPTVGMEIRRRQMELEVELEREAAANLLRWRQQRADLEMMEDQGRAKVIETEERDRLTQEASWRLVLDRLLLLEEPRSPLPSHPVWAPRRHPPHRPPALSSEDVWGTAYAPARYSVRFPGDPYVYDAVIPGMGE